MFLDKNDSDISGNSSIKPKLSLTLSLSGDAVDDQAKLL